MSKLMILGQLEQLNTLLLESFTDEEVKNLSFGEHLSLLLNHTSIQSLSSEEEEQLIELLKRQFPEWKIEPKEPEPPDLVNIAYVLQKLGVAPSTFYRTINHTLLKSTGRIGGSPMYLKSDVDWLGAEALRIGGGKWVYSKLGKLKKKPGSSDDDSPSK